MMARGEGAISVDAECDHRTYLGSSRDPRLADAFVNQLRQRYGCDPVAIIDRLEIAAGHRALLLDAHHDKESEVTGREDIERMILHEESILAQVARLLETGSALEVWPADARAALALALDEPSMSLPERWRAVALRRHLFGPVGSAPARLAASGQPSTLDRRRAECLRSSLPALVRYRVATYLLQAR